MNTYNEDIQGHPLNGAGWTHLCSYNERNIQNKTHYSVDDPSSIPAGTVTDNLRLFLFLPFPLQEPHFCEIITPSPLHDEQVETC